MTPHQYSSVVVQIVSTLLVLVAAMFGAVSPRMSRMQWRGLLRILYPHVERARLDAARAARSMYDDQRRFHHPELPRNDRPLEGSSFEEFERSMEPTRRRMSQVDSAQKAVGVLSRGLARSVENSGRRQIIHAVENDPAPGVQKMWARVATGRETCAWCLMLVSRGAVYESEKSAGGLDEWHDGCDCKVVPVFRPQFWPGKKAADEAYALWRDAAREAADLIKSGKARTEDYNQETLNVIRRRIYRGEINPITYAGLAA